MPRSYRSIVAILSSAIFRIASLEISSGPDIECFTETCGFSFGLFFLASGGFGSEVLLYLSSIAAYDLECSPPLFAPNLMFLSGIIFFCAMLYFEVWKVGFYEYYGVSELVFRILLLSVWLNLNSPVLVYSF